MQNGRRAGRDETKECDERAEKETVLERARPVSGMPQTLQQKLGRSGEKLRRTAESVRRLVPQHLVQTFLAAARMDRV